MLAGSVGVGKSRVRPITCKISNNSNDSNNESVGVQKPQTSVGVALKESQKHKSASDRKTKAKPISAVWNKSQPLSKGGVQKNIIKELNGLSSDVAKVLRDEGYIIGKSIGEGSYCKVRVAFKALEHGYEKKIACKMIDKKKASNEFVVKFLPRELGIIKRISHPNIVSVYNVFEIENTVFIFMELCEQGDLLDYIRNKGALPEHRAKHFFRQIVNAVEYLHSLDIAHRDLKCENVLLSRRDVVKITDFGFARWCKNDSGQRILSETFCGSAAYAAPEILQINGKICSDRSLCRRSYQGKLQVLANKDDNTQQGALIKFLSEKKGGSPINFGSLYHKTARQLKALEKDRGHAYNPKMYDIWSLGCVLYIMLTATMPFDDSNVAQMLEIQLTKSLTFPSKSQVLLSPLAKKLVMETPSKAAIAEARSDRKGIISVGFSCVEAMHKLIRKDNDFQESAGGEGFYCTRDFSTHLLAPDITRRATLAQVSKSFWLQRLNTPPSVKNLAPNAKR